MPSYASCPHCSAKLFAGPLAKSAAAVSCPTCEKEFAPSELNWEALAEVVVVAPGDLPAAVGPEVSAPHARRRSWSNASRSEPSHFFRRMLLMLMGGAVGIALGYLALLWIGGPDRDFLKIAPRLPGWALPPAFQLAKEIQEKEIELGAPGGGTLEADPEFPPRQRPAVRGMEEAAEEPLKADLRDDGPLDE